MAANSHGKARTKIQSKLLIGDPGDTLQREADRISEHVIPVLKWRREKDRLIQRKPLTAQVTPMRRQKDPIIQCDGFRLQDLQRVRQLSFRGNLSPLPADVQSILRDNIEATVRFVLDPNDPRRQQEIARLRSNFETRYPGMPWYDQPATRVHSEDLYHGHVVVPPDVLRRNPTLQRLSREAFSSSSAHQQEITERIGVMGPSNQQEARETMDIVRRYRGRFLDFLGPILQELRGEPTAAVVYHAQEGSDRARVGGQRLSSGHPIRTILTLLSNSRPHFMRFPFHFHPRSDNMYVHLILFSFHIDARGRITLMPNTHQAVRAAEILYDQSAQLTPHLEGYVEQQTERMREQAVETVEEDVP